MPLLLGSFLRIKDGTKSLEAGSQNRVFLYALNPSIVVSMRIFSTSVFTLYDSILLH